MFDTVLIPTDPNESDPIVQEFGIAIASQFGGSIRVLSVLEGGQRRDRLRADHEAKARVVVDEIVRLAEERSVDANGEVRSGMAHEEILDYLGDAAIDLVVMGTQARTGVDRLLLGSVAEEVIRESPVPVLAVTPEAEPSVHD